MHTHERWAKTKQTALRAVLAVTLTHASGGAYAAMHDPADPAPNPGLTPKVLYTGSQCGFEQSAPRLRWIDSETELEHAFADLTRMEGGAKMPPKVDFTSHGVLLVDMGTRPTAGYGLSLGKDTAHITDDATLVLPIRWRTPPQGVMLAQVLTNPCMLVALPRTGYERIRVVDQDGTVRGDMDLSASP